ncbi:MAG: PorT family protein [Salinivirgaceae bacterium]|nr:PorT family protein [Salinivirgaceae bacterium]
MNKNKLTYFILLLFLLLMFNSNAQSDCIVKLNEAEKLFEEGKIEKIPNLLQECIENGFNKENKIAALRLLTNVYLFEDNQIKAEKTLLKLLKTDPEFAVNKAIDPLEFITLYNSYHTSPVFSLGGSLSLNNSLPILLETYSVNSFEDADPKYSGSGVGFSVGLIATYHINNFIDVSLEPSFINYKYSLTENVTQVNTTTAIENYNYLELPIYGSYVFYKLSKYSLFGEFGMIYNKLISSDFVGIKAYNNNEYTEKKGTIDTKAIRQNFNIMTSLGVGARVKLNRSNLQFKLRYKYGFMNLINTESRYIDHEGMTTEYFYIDNDVVLTNLSFSVCYSREFYIHKKKPSNKTNYEIIK